MRAIIQSFRRSVSLLAISLALPPQHVFAQQTLYASAELPRNHEQTSVSVSALAQLTAARITETKTDLITQSLSPSAGVLSRFGRAFNHGLAIH